MADDLSVHASDLHSSWRTPMHIRLRAIVPLVALALLGACGDDDPPSAPIVTAPAAPTAVVASIGNASVSLAFTAPTSDGGTPITTYVATCTASDTSLTGSATSSPVAVTGMANGTVYSCSVAARNSVGLGVASESVTVTPAASE
jgi:Fibronectin type III domain